MRLQVDGGGYDTATDAFLSGNQVAAACHQQLTGSLAGCGAMAGTDSSAADFASAYDAAAGQGVHALADLVGSFANVGGLAHASAGNHRVAEARSVIGGARVYEGGPMPDGERVTVLPSVPPTALGGDSPALPTTVNLVLDHVGGILFPDADVDRLRTAASAWRTAAETLGVLEGCCDRAVRGFRSERSPELPLAIDATRELQEAIREVADQLAALGAACDDYADHVEAARRELLDLACWLAEQVVEGLLVGAALGALTGGAAAGASMAAVFARIAAESPRFARVIEVLRSLVAAVAARVRGTRDAVAAARTRLVKFTQAKVPVRDERGTLRLPGGGKPRLLDRHEVRGSHTKLKHIEVSDDQLLYRYVEEPWLTHSSTFTDQTSAESAIAGALREDARGIEMWLHNPRRPYQIDGTAREVVGRCAHTDGTITESRDFRVVLVPDTRMPEGFRILTSYPTH